jgi:3-hydroxybutyryl-CoA dehydrogenase
MTRFGICGAGTMGAGIACAALQVGFRVFLYDTSEAARTRGINFIRETFASCATLKELSVCEIVLEAIVEDKSIKNALFTQLEVLLRPDAIIASNTSSIAITALAQDLKRPERFIGMHFFNPAHVMKLVEVIPGKHTTAEVTQSTQQAAQKLGKIAVIAKDVPGFIVNRVARNFYLEAMRIVMEGGANLVQVDALMRSAGFKMGPFELMDVIGLDVNFAVTLSVWEQYFREPRFAPAQMQREYVEAGLLGKKTGAGFYQYSSK